MLRTILVTQVVDKQGKQHNIYGRYDAVALFNNGYTVILQYKAVYEMSDTDFAKYGTLKQRIGE